MLTVTVDRAGNQVILRCRGRIVAGEEETLLCTALRYSQDIILDLADVETIDAAGLGLLVSLQAAGTYLKLANVPRQVRELLHVTELLSVFETCECSPARTGAQDLPTEQRRAADLANAVSR